MIKQSQFISEPLDDKTLRSELKTQGIDARRLSRFTQLALLGALPLKAHITPNTPIYLASRFSSPSKFNKMFQQLNEHDLPSPLDFMANLNNAATFQLAQTLGTTSTSLFLAVSKENLWQPLELALIALEKPQQTALIGWVLESPINQAIEGSIWFLIDRKTDIAQLKLDALAVLHKLFQIV